MAFSRDGQYLASASDHELRVWEVDTGRVQPLEGGAPVAFSPDGKWLVSAGGAKAKVGELKIWDLSSGQKVRDLVGHSDFVNAVAFSPDGGRLVSASDDRTIRLWDPASGLEVFALRDQTSQVRCVAFSPDGRRIVSGGIDQTAKVWDVGPNDADVMYRREAVALGDRGDSALKAGRWDEAAAAFTAALIFQPDNPRFLLGRGRALARLGRLEQGEADFARAAARASNDAQLLITIGRDSTEFGLKNRALAAFTRAATLRPDDARHQIVIARCFAELVRPIEADAALVRAATLAPNDPQIQVAIGRIHAELGRSKEADAHFAQAAALAPDDPQIFLDGAWWVVGPYALVPIQTSFPPESAPDPSRPVAAVGGSNSNGRAVLRWRSIPAGGHDHVDFRAALRPGPSIGVSAYALAYVHVEANRNAVMSLLTGEAARVWINGKLVHEEPEEWIYPFKHVQVPVQLRAGRNTLLAKAMISSWGRFTLRLRFAASPSNPVSPGPANSNQVRSGLGHEDP